MGQGVNVSMTGTFDDSLLRHLGGFWRHLPYGFGDTKVKTSSLGDETQICSRYFVSLADVDIIVCIALIATLQDLNRLP